MKRGKVVGIDWLFFGQRLDGSLSCTQSWVLNCLRPLLTSEINPFIWSYLFWKIASSWRNQVALVHFSSEGYLGGYIGVDILLQNLKNQNSYQHHCGGELFLSSLLFVFWTIIAYVPKLTLAVAYKNFYFTLPDRTSKRPSLDSTWESPLGYHVCLTCWILWIKKLPM